MKNILGSWIFMSVIVLLFGMAILVNVVFKQIDERIETIKLEVQEVIEGTQCEFTYKEIHYKGICTEELMKDVTDLIGFDYSVDLLKMCMQNPYAYRYELCEDMEVN